MKKLLLKGFILGILAFLFNKFIFIQDGLTQEEPSYLLEEVKVVAPVKKEKLEKIAQEVKVIKGDELINLGPEIYSGVDLRERGIFGVQQDLSIRGTTFEQNLVTLEGIRISDPQTGHHLMNLPWENRIVESLEILPGGTSALYGPGGFGGVLNFNLKIPQREVKFLAGYGSYDYKEIYGNLGFNKSSFPLELAFSQKKAQGFVWNRDFDIRTFNLYTKDEKKILFYGFQEKDFGARNFYTTKYSTEWETTKNHLFLLKKVFYGQNWFLEPGVLYRIHYDTYLLDRKKPSFYKNTHKSQVLRLNFPFRYETFKVDYLLGTELSYETLDSSRLGEHSRQAFGFYFWFYPKLSYKFFPSFGIRYDSVAKNKDIFSYNLGLAYLIKTELKWRTSLGFSYRIPSFTELYYDSPTIKGNPNLSPEKAYQFETGLDYEKNIFKSSFTIFYRQGRDIIDWVNYQGFRRAENLDRVKTLGFTLDGKLSFKNFSPFYSYTYLNQVSKKLKNSHYQGFYLRHKLVLGTSVKLPYQMEAMISANFQERYQMDKVWLCSFRISKLFYNKVKATLWAENLFDEDYEEISRVKGLPQWFGLNLEFKF